MKIFDRSKIPDCLSELGFAAERFPEFRTKEWGYHLHGHDFTELFVILSGEALYQSDEQQFRIGSGTVCITHPGHVHNFNTGGRPLDIINLYLDMSRLRLPVLEEPLLNAIRSVLAVNPRTLHRQKQFSRLQLDDVHPVAALLLEMLAEQEARASGWQDNQRALLHVLFARLARQVLAQGILPRDNGESTLARKLEAIRWRIEQYPEEEFVLDRLAAANRINKYQLCREFKKYTGRTLFEYLYLVRIEKALVMLSSGDEKIITIAGKCGFSDLAFFNRKFKQIIGKTPREYRLESRQKQIPQ